MARKTSAGKRGPMGPPGPPGQRGPTGSVGPRGPKGKAPLGVLRPGADSKHLFKALDAQVDGIYRELTRQMNRMSQLQSQLEEVRLAIRRLAGPI